MAKSYTVTLSLDDKKFIDKLDSIIGKSKEAKANIDALSDAVANLGKAMATSNDVFRAFNRFLSNMARRATKATAAILELINALNGIPGAPPIPGGGGGGNGGGGGGGGSNGGNKTPGGALRNLIRTTRISSNGQMMPLVGRLADFFMTLFPAFEGAILGITVGLGILVESFRMATAALDPIIQMQGSMGFSNARAGQVSGLIGAIGQSPITNAINASNDTSNPYLLGFAAQHGISMNFAGAFGDINNAKRFQKLFLALTNPNVSSDTVARATYGNSALANPILLARQSNFNQQTLEGYGAFASLPAASSNVQKTSVAQSQIALGAAFTALKNNFIELYALLSGAVTFLANIVVVIGGLVGKLLGLIATGVSWVFQKIFGFFGLTNTSHGNSVHDNTKALNDNTNQLRKITGTAQFYGPDSRNGARSLPGSLMSPQLNNQRLRGAIPLGGLQ